MPMLCTRMEDINRGGTRDLPRAFTTWLFPPPLDKHCEPGREYKYTLKDCNLPKRQFDPVLDVIHATIRELEAEDMCVAASKIRVRNATSSPPIWPIRKKNGENYAVKFYIFHEYYEEFPMTLPVAIFDRRRKLTIENLFVRIKCQWEPLRKWLLGLPNRDILLPGEDTLPDVRVARLIQTQQMWWRRNGKHFPLMELPMELYFEVLRHVLGGEIHPCVYNGRVLMGPRSVEQMRRREVQWTGSTIPNYNILLANKQIHVEALEAAWVGTVKYFKNLAVFEDVFRAPSPLVVDRILRRAIGVNWLSRVEFDFTHTGHFQFFGIRSNLDIQPEARLLLNATTITHLTIRFQLPGSSNPWKELFAATEAPCHEAMIDWTLHSAYPYIKHIPHVRLKGFVKTNQKKYWERVLRTHTHPWREVTRCISTIPSHVVPMCTCPLPCTQEQRNKLEHSSLLAHYREDDEDTAPFDYDDQFTPDLLRRAHELGERIDRYGEGLGIRRRSRIPSYWMYDYKKEESFRLLLVGFAKNLELYEALYPPSATD